MKSLYIILSLLVSVLLISSRTVTIPSNCGTPNITRLYEYIDSTVASYDYCEGTEWAFYNLQSTSSVLIQSYNANNGQQTASTIKLWVLLAVLQDIQNGLYTLDTPMQCAGLNSTVDSCLALMISISDNCATYDNTKLTTLAHVNKVFQQLNMTNSGFHSWCFTTCPGYTSPCPNNDGTGIENTLTSHDVVKGLHQLYQFQILSTELTYQAYKYLLTAHGWSPMLATFIPSPIAHKQGCLPADEGFLPFTENDEAIVFTECGDFAVSVMITRNWTNPHEDNNALQLGAEIGRLAYCTMVPFGYASDGTSCETTWSTPLPSPTGC